MTTPAETLELIALSAAPPDLAIKAIATVLADQTDSDRFDRVWFALRSWGWKAINQRRKDPDLKHWQTIIARAHAQAVRSGYPDAAKFQALEEMIGEQIASASLYDVDEVLERTHVKTILRLLAPAPGNSLPRATLIRETGLKQSNLTRILTMMMAVDLLERQPSGKEAAFRLTQNGKAASEKIPKLPKPEIKDTWVDLQFRIPTLTEINPQEIRDLLALARKARSQADVKNKLMNFIQEIDDEKNRKVFKVNTQFNPMPPPKELHNINNFDILLTQEHSKYGIAS